MSALRPDERYYGCWQQHDGDEPEEREVNDLGEVVRLVGSYTEGYLTWLDIQCGGVETDAVRSLSELRNRRTLALIADMQQYHMDEQTADWLDEITASLHGKTQ